MKASKIRKEMFLYMADYPNIRREML